MATHSSTTNGSGDPSIMVSARPQAGERTSPPSSFQKTPPATPTPSVEGRVNKKERRLDEPSEGASSSMHNSILTSNGITRSNLGYRYENAAPSPPHGRQQFRSSLSRESDTTGAATPLNDKLTAHKDTIPSPQRQPASFLKTHYSNQQSNQANGYSPPRPQRVIQNNNTEIKLKMMNLPENCDTRYIFDIFEKYGNIIKIEILEPRNIDPADRRSAFVIFKPPPRNYTWIRRNYKVEIGGSIRFIDICQQNSPSYLQESPLDRDRKFQDKTTIPISEISFGVMETSISMKELKTITSTPAHPVHITLDLQFKCLDVEFDMVYPAKYSAYSAGTQRTFKIRINLPQIASVIKLHNPTNQIALVVTAAMPPLLYRKTNNPTGTHERGATYWNEWQTWYRQTGIGQSQEVPGNVMIQLQKEDDGIDIGRWLTYKLVFSAPTATTKDFQEACDALYHHNITIQMDKQVEFTTGQSEQLWAWLDNPSAVSDHTSGSSALSEMHQMAKHAIHLPFEVRYQLEACISNGLLHECNVNNDFLSRVSCLERERAVKLLEKVADEKDRIFNPMDIFPRFLHKASIVRKRVPVYCASIRSATITPTTVYFFQATVETSNSIIRKYRHYEDRFLRVKFTDERYKGKIMSSDDSTMNEVYTRIKRAMKNGINVGGRRYEFLAFGNSQFREGGAYFFASTSSCSAQDIRDALGDFRQVERTVAKYCARVGQAFATTRAVGLSVKVENIPDIERNGFCFTDGVGKMSPFLAQMTAREHGLPSSADDHPSVFQFRLGGCKGVLAVDPSLPGKVIQIRPSQRKFEIPNQHLALDICRISQLSAANLNMQLILVLSTLGVEDDIFLDKADEVLRDLSSAMTDEQKALDLLQRNIDFNQMTIQLAQMIFDGFMEARDPFMMTSLRLWQAWSIKYLKEKARIYIEQGAFVLGCIDEMAVLTGHFDEAQDATTNTKDTSALPEVFLQVESPPSSGKWTVITGICIMARNPSLHPGDVRVVMAVDKPELHRHRNCLVLPQTGDRDLANMCSGGDLDGDDYLLIWDPDLIPQEWNHPAMDFKGEKAKESEGPVTVDDMTSFFVTYMKYDNLGQIAVAHRHWADASPDGVKDPKCLELAALHSTAVDYVKSGVPAKMKRSLRMKRWPHWANAKNKAKRMTYISKKVLGKLYDKVQRVDMHPAWDLEFDSRILQAYVLDSALLNIARKAKQEYDAAMLRIMAKFSIETEFEVWTTFVMEHSNDWGDYKFAETIGEESQTLKDHYQQMCFDLAGTDKKDQKYQDKIAPFVAAMYIVTNEELDAALEECKKVKLVRGLQVHLREKTAAGMPFISFPWLFPRELGILANKGTGPREGMAGAQQPMVKLPQRFKKPEFDHFGCDFVPEPLAEVKPSGSTSLADALLNVPLNQGVDIFTAHLDSNLQSTYSARLGPPFEDINICDNAARQDSPMKPRRSTFEAGMDQSTETKASDGKEQCFNSYKSTATVVNETKTSAEEDQGEDTDEESTEANRVTIPVKKSALDDLERLLGM